MMIEIFILLGLECISSVARLMFLCEWTDGCTYKDGNLDVKAVCLLIIIIDLDSL